MKKILIVLLCSFSLAMSVPAIAQNSSIVINEAEHSVFKGLFKSVWARLKTFNPSAKDSARSQQVYTAGIRGEEATDTLLQPYWKDDLTQDESFQAELRKYGLAQGQMDKGELEAAIKSFDDFLSEFGQSDLRPNALFGKGLSLAAIGNNDGSRQTMQQFIDENPNHPMVGDAVQVLDGLK